MSNSPTAGVGEQGWEAPTSSSLVSRPGAGLVLSWSCWSSWLVPMDSGLRGNQMANSASVSSPEKTGCRAMGLAGHGETQFKLFK